MAQRRMFSKNITNSARFLKMPKEVQNLYFHLCMHADDDGIVEAFTVMQILGAEEDSIKLLAVKGFVKPLNEDLVTYILDWTEHNLIRSDRKIDSIYKDLLLQLVPEAELVQAKPRADTRKLTGGQPMDVQWTAQDRVVEDRLISEQSSQKFEIVSEEEKPPKEKKFDPQPVYKIFKEELGIAPLNWRTNKTQRQSAENLLTERGEEQIRRALRFYKEVKEEPYCPAILSPYDLDSKWHKLLKLKN